MPGLAGDFSTMPLKDLVVYLGNRKASGTLKLERGEVRKQVILRDGEVMNASSNVSREFFGQFLINMGHLSEDQFTKAYATQRETKIFLGKILVMIGLVSEQTVKSALSMKFRETLLDAFSWSDGAFQFDAQQDPQLLEGLDVSVDLLDVHREGEFRETAWQAIRAAFPSGSARLQVHEDKLPEPPKPGSLDERLIGLIQEDMTIDEMALTLHASDFYLYQRLYALFRLDAVSVREDDGGLYEPDVTTVVGAESPAAEVLEAARRFLNQGNAQDAETLARRAHEMSPTPESAQLLRTAGASLLTSLRRELTESPQVASLLVPAAYLKTLQLSAPERYLLSRIDGSREVGAIVQFSPLQELDALKYFHGFVESALVKLEPRAPGD